MGNKQGNVKTVSFSREVSGLSAPSIYQLSTQFIFVLVCLVLCIEWDVGHTNIYFEMRYDKVLRTSPGLVPAAVGDKTTACFLENLTGEWGRPASLKDWERKVTR